MEFGSVTKQLIQLALFEDIRQGDITSCSIFDPERRSSAIIISREPLVVCGQPVASEVFKTLDPSIDYETIIPDGVEVGADIALSRISGKLISILEAERTSLNFFQRLSGIATQTAQLKKLAGDKVQLLDTRKTTPGFRELERYAVRVGGGVNHRAGLFDVVLIKNNHIDALSGNILGAVKSCREKCPPGIPVEVEVRDRRELDRAIESKADKILLDNFSIEDLADAVLHARRLNSTIFLEASGGINRHNISQYAQTGVDAISLGALTHSVKASDLSLRIHG